MESSEEIKARILEMGDSPGYSEEETIELNDDEGGEEEVSEVEEEQDASDRLFASLQRYEEEQKSRMDPLQKVALDELKRRGEAERRSQLREDFEKDSLEAAQVIFADSPAVLRRFQADLTLGKVPSLDDDEAKTSDSAPARMVEKWADLKQKEILEDFRRETPHISSHVRLGELINGINAAKKQRIGNRLRNRVYQFDKPQQKMTKKNITDQVATYFEEQEK